ncbi:MAG: pyrroloquinoline quinone biosynthesis protein PqqE [Myxococcota bacterium]
MKPPAPMAVICELTHRCPLSCPYCSNPLELTKKSAELSTEDWLSVLDQAADLGVLQAHLTGGEPTARDDLETLVARAEERGLYTNLITAAVTLTRPRLQRLVESGLQHVQISFQAVEPELADRVGGFAGGHLRKIEAASWVKALDIPLTVNAVMHRGNMDQAEDMIAFALELGAQRVEIANVQYYGWGLHNRGRLLPTRAQLDHVTKVVEAARARLAGRIVIDYVVPDYYARRPKACMGGWGQRVLNVMPDGTVQPCHAASSIPDLVFENARDRPLAEIWSDSPAFRRFRGTAWMPEPCVSCDRREIDWGGCRCQALAVTGDADVTDPACEKSPHHNDMVQLTVDEAAPELGEFTPRRYSSLPIAKA